VASVVKNKVESVEKDDTLNSVTQNPKLQEPETINQKLPKPPSE